MRIFSYLIISVNIYKTVEFLANPAFSSDNWHCCTNTPPFSPNYLWSNFSGKMVILNPINYLLFYSRGLIVIYYLQMQFMLLFSRQGKLRLQKWYVAHPDKLKKKITRELITTILARKPKMSSFLEWKDVKVVYKRLVKY